MPIQTSSQDASHWEQFLRSSLDTLLKQPLSKFSQMIPSDLPKAGGVYLITKIVDEEKEEAYYVGRTGNIRQRLYQQHLMGQLDNARLKKYLIDDKVCANPDQAKTFIKAHCAARWIVEENYRKRGAIEGFCLALLFPKYGIAIEH